MLKWVAGFLLHYANGCHHSIGREQFYSLKRKLLSRFGRFQKTVLQYVADDCWDCDSNGCSRCGFTGTYREFWARHDVMSIGPWRFLSPVGDVIESRPQGEVDIVGRIRRPARHKNAEAKLWLYLLFDRDSFYRLFRSSRRHRVGLWPMLMLQSICFSITSVIRRHESRAAARRFQAQARSHQTGSDPDIPF